MPDTVGFHFVLLSAGEILKQKDTVTAQDIQDFIFKDEAFGIRLPLDDCRLALKLLEEAHFIYEVSIPFREGVYTRTGIR